MSRFFIDRPIFAWVIALFVMIAGALSLTQLPVTQYPAVAPPAIQIAVAYPGASAQTLDDSVLSIIEREMNGAPGLMYMESVAQADGSGTLTLSFEQGTDAQLAQVDVQNRLNRATPRLPAAVAQQGVRVEQANNTFLLFVMLSSTDGGTDPVALATTPRAAWCRCCSACPVWGRRSCLAPSRRCASGSTRPGCRAWA